VNIRETPAYFDFARRRVARPDSSQTKITNRRAHSICELQPPPCWRLSEQVNQYALCARTRIGGLRSHFAMKVALRQIFCKMSNKKPLPVGEGVYEI
jgi:hypothetical protein